MKKYIRQINNLRIYYSELYQYSVWTPDNRCIEDRLDESQAIIFCILTKDFVRRGKIK